MMVQYIKGVGPVVAERLRRLGVLTVEDLFRLLPTRYLDRRHLSNIAEVPAGKDQAVVGEVVASGIGFVGRRRQRIYQVILADETARLTAIWFHFNLRYMQKILPVGRKVLFSGEVGVFGGQKQMIHPDVDPPEVSGRILPVYPLTEGLYQRQLRKIVKNAWDRYGGEVQRFRDELHFLHFPSEASDIEALNLFRSPAHQTLIFDELFFLELGLAMRRRTIKKEQGIAFVHNKEMHQRLLQSLPFALTADQQKVLQEISEDMAEKTPMQRLLQGDVGSGKTIVAVSAMLQAVANGYQAAIMAPTEILAEQHARTIGGLLQPLGIPVVFLTSQIRGAEREKIYQSVAAGESPVVIGTHALVQEGLKFHKLGLVVIDEQHRFGVLQRQSLQKKSHGLEPDVLVMTATPIPRTLALTIYGDLDVSVIREKPKDRKPILTRLYHEQIREKLYQGMRSEVEKGRQVYVVYPLIEESEKVDLKNATAMAEEIRKNFPEVAVALLHGRMKAEQKETTMHDFVQRQIHILVTTSVVEVGVDVPNASVMVVEHAERFGLSQLHQLRGRVGRSHYQSYCILMADWAQSEIAKQRLQVMVESEDGFHIAEEDLRIRGPGEFLGTRQSGIPVFQVANLVRDIDLLQKARDKAFAILRQDPELSHPEHLEYKKILTERWAGRLGLMEVA